MKYCEDYAALLDPYIDGELSPEDTARVREHLTECGGCRAYVQAALLLRENFPEIEETEVPDGFAESVMGAIRSGAAPQKKRRAPWAKVLLPLAACCAIVILVRSLPVGVPTADTASADAVTEAAVQDDAETPQDDAAIARISPPEAEESAGVREDDSVEESDEALPEADAKTGVTMGAAQPHVYTAVTEEPAEDGGIGSSALQPESETGAAANGQEDGAGVDAVQPETQSENGVAAATTTAQDPSWFATLTLTPEQAGTALDALPDNVPVSHDPETGGTVYWLTAEQFDALLAQLGDPAYTAEGDGELARVILLPE